MMIKILATIFLFVSTTSCSQNIDKIRAVKSEQILEFELENTITGYKKGERKSNNGFGTDEMISYDTNGNVLMVYHLTSADNPVLRQKFIYNSASKPVSLSAYNDNGETISTRKYFYDNENRITREEFTILQNAAGLKNTISTYQYNSRNDYVIFYSEMNETTNEYELNNKQSVKTDAHQNIIEKRFFNPASEMYREEYNEYNAEHHLLTSRIIDQWNDTKTDYFYDDESNIIKTIATSKNHTNQTNYEYSYDQYGNWITKKVIRKNGGEQAYFDRTLVYF